MKVQIVARTPDHDEMVRRFNERAVANGSPFLLGATADAGWLARKSDEQPVVRDCFVAVDGDEVRGGFVLRKQNFLFEGEVTRIGNYQGPISEGIWDRRFALLGVQMLRAALRHEPLLYCLGMGGRDQPLPKLLAAAGWSMAEVPFRFKVFDGTAFLREMPILRKKPLLRLLSRLGLCGRIGPAGISIVQGLRGGWRMGSALTGSFVPEFGEWCDVIWKASGRGNCLGAIRDRDVQNCVFVRYPGKNLILKLERAGEVMGWAVVRATQMEDDKHFGNLRVGSLVDCMCASGSERDVVAGAEKALRDLGCQMVLSNQTRETWLEGMDRNGWLPGPSNFLIALSPGLAGLAGNLPEALATMHFNRADGDGPIHL